MDGVKQFPVSKLFHVELGSGVYTKTWCRDHAGKYPVYSGQTVGAYDYVDCYDYCGDYLSWSKDGLAGFIRVHDGESFSATNHRGILELKKDFDGLISLLYMKYALEPLFRAARVGRLTDGEQDEYTTLNKTAVSSIMVPVPILEDGETPDYKRQVAYAKKMSRVDILREQLQSERSALNSLDVDVVPLVEGVPHKAIPVGKVFDVKRGSGKYTKAYMSEHSGEFPVYTAMAYEAAGAIDTYDYEGHYLTVSLNGLAGKMLEVDGCFSCTADRAVFVPKNDNTFDLVYVKAALEASLREMRHGRLADGEKNEYTKLGVSEIRDVEFLVPINDAGDYDIEEQRRIADRYEQLIGMRRKVCSEIDAICKIDIDFDI